MRSKMSLVELCLGIAFLLGIHETNIYVVPVEIDCVPLDNCPFAVKILASSRDAQFVGDFLNASVCGAEEGSNRTKIWCAKLTDCKTPDLLNGTCTDISKCPVLNNTLQNANSGQNTENLLNMYRCPSSGTEEEQVCCPWVNVSNAKLLPSKPGSGERIKRYVGHFPWHMHNDENFGKSREHGFGHHFHDHRSYFEEDSSESHKSSSEYEDDWFKNTFHDTAKNDPYNNNDLFSTRFYDNNDFVDTGSDDHYNINKEKKVFTKGSCLMPDNLKGTCKEIHHCTSMLNVLKRLNHTTNIEKDFLKKFRCPSSKRSGTILVCCSNRTIVLPNESSTEAQEIDVDQKDKRSPVPELRICGRQILYDKITGGVTTGLAEFPWIALLQYRTRKGRKYGCGGSVISERYILTAAHCINHATLREAGFLSLDKVILGEYDTRNETDCFINKYGSDCAEPPQLFNVDRIIEHESFIFNGTHNDIALIRVDRDIKFSNYIKPICLPDKNSLRLLGNESFVIAGWGRTETGETSPVKRKARLSFTARDNCNQLLSDDGKICLGNGNGIDSCSGDSGGPVMYSAPLSGDLVTTLIGIISYGFGKCGTGPSVNTYVPFYLDWISSHLS